MRMIRCEFVPRTTRLLGHGMKLLKLLEEFYNSDMDAAMLEPLDGEYKHVSSAYCGVKRAIDASHLPIRAMVRQGHLYIQKISAKGAGKGA